MCIDQRCVYGLKINLKKSCKLLNLKMFYIQTKVILLTKSIILEYSIDYFPFQNSGLRAWLEALSINGCAMIQNASLDENDCRKIANRIGFIRKTHYGEEYFVRHRENTNNLAYRSEPLQMHTDLPYYEYTPGINLLHCIVQSSSPGAFNLLTDGFYLAERLKAEYPNYYRILTETLVNWSDYGEENGNQFKKIYRLPIIRFV